MCTYPLKIFNPANQYARREDDKIQVPCGQCIECRLHYARHLSLRVEHEARDYTELCFLTLTYRDDQLVWGYDVPTLYPKHLQLFMKRLRKKLEPKKLRMLACGEYGDRYGRPHYHMILLGHDFKSDRKSVKSKSGHSLWASDILNQIWSHGDCVIGNADYDSIQYTCSYTLKKCTGRNKGIYKCLGIEPEFMRISRGGRTGYGLGHNFYQKYGSKILARGKVVNSDGVDVSIPRYYLNKFKDSVDEQTYLDYKQSRIDECKIDPEKNTRARLNARAQILYSRQLSYLRDFE